MAEQQQSEWSDRHLWRIRPVRDLFWLSLIVFLIWLGYLLRSIFTPVLVALALAYLFTPAIDFAHRRWRMPRPLTISLIIGVLAVAVAGLLMWIGPIVVRQAVALIQKTPHYLQTMGERLEWEFGDYQEQLAALGERLRTEPAAVAKAAFAGTSQAFGFIGNIISTTTYVAITAILIPIYFFFFAVQFDPMVRQVERYLPASSRQRTIEILRKMDKAVSSFFRGRVIIGLIMAVLFAIGWCPLITDVPYWLLLALLTGLLSLIPYAAALGWLLALLFKAMELFSASGDATTLTWVLGLGGPSVVYGIVQLFEGWLLTPWLQGRAMELSAVTILITVFVGAALGGLYGMILAIPLAACGKILLQDVVLPHLKTWADQH
jgi:predicted PurR-regulated permease PerM